MINRMKEYFKSKIRRRFGNVISIFMVAMFIFSTVLPIFIKNESHAQDTQWGVTRVDLSPFIYFEYDYKGKGSDYFFYGAALEVDWQVPSNIKAGDYFDLQIPDEVRLKTKLGGVFGHVKNPYKPPEDAEIFFDLVKTSENNIRFVATKNVEKYFQVLSEPVVGIGAKRMVIGNPVQTNLVKSATSYDGGRVQASQANNFQGYNFFEGWIPNKELFKSDNGSPLHRDTLKWTSTYMGESPVELYDETDINYDTEVNVKTRDRRFGLVTVYPEEEGDDYVIYGLVYDATGEQNFSDDALDVSFAGFYRSSFMKTLPYTYRIKTLELYDKKPGNIYTGTSFEVYEGEPSGSLIPKNLRPAEGVWIENIDTREPPQNPDYNGNGTQYKIHFGPKSYYVRIKARKRKTIKNIYGEDSYKFSLRRIPPSSTSENLEIGNTRIVDDFYHPTGVYAGGIGVGHPPEPFVPEKTVKGTVKVEHWGVSNGTRTILKREVVKENEPVGTEYTTSSETFPGYKFNRVAANSAPTEGTVTEGEKTVIYIYTPLDSGNVDVIHKTVDGQVLYPWSGQPERIKTAAPIGEHYSTSIIPSSLHKINGSYVKGYRFLRMADDSAPAEGYVKPGDQHVVYLYEKTPADAKTGNVYVNHVYYKRDSQGGYIRDPVTGNIEVVYLKSTDSVLTNAPIGTDYSTHKENFPGYEFVTVDARGGKPQGKVTAEDTIVTYVYKPIKTTSVSVTKKWIGKEASNTKVELLANGNPVRTQDGTLILSGLDSNTFKNIVDLNSGNEWKHTFENLPARDEYDAVIDYTVREVGENNGYVTIEGSTYSVAKEGNQNDGFLITNSRSQVYLPNTGWSAVSFSNFFILLFTGFICWLINRFSKEGEM